MLRKFYIFILLLLGLALAGISAPSNAKPPHEAGDVTAQPTDKGARIVFSWNSKAKVDFKPEVKDNRVLLHFDEPVSLEWGDTLSRLTPYLKEVSTSNSNKTVVLTLDSAAEAREFLMYSKNGIDFSRNGIELIQTHKTSSGQPNSTMPVLAKAKQEHFTKPKDRRHLSVSPTKVIAKRKTPKSTTIAKNKTSKPEATTQLAKPDEVAATLANLSPAAGAEKETPASSPPAAEPAKANQVASGIEKDKTDNAQTVATASDTKSEAKPSISAQPDPPKERIVLPLTADDTMAVFQNGTNLWVAVSDKTPFSEDTIRNENKSLTYKIQTISAKDGKILSLSLDKTISPTVEEKEGKLAIVLNDSPIPPADSPTLTLNTQDNKTSLHMEMVNAGKPITAVDPATGAELHIIPVAKPGLGLNAAHSFVEFSLLPTAQGVVASKIADGLNLALNKDTLEISTPKGLAVSDELKKKLEEDQSKAATAKAPKVLFPYALWKLDDPKKYVKTQLSLFKETISDNLEDANKARLKLLTLYLSEGLFSEANGMANDILRNSYIFYRDHKVAALRGAANFFRYRFAEAEQDFSSPELADSKEVQMWLTLCRDVMNRENNVFVFAPNYGPFIKQYPPSFIQKIAIIAADKSINRKEYDGATAIFVTLQKEGLDEPVKKYIDFMRAKILAETNNEDEAAKIWERQAGEITDRLIRARAEFSLINMYLKEDKIPPEDAAKRLEKLRIVWRGDALELNVLTLLGNLYVELKDYSKALRAWRDIVAYYPEVPDAIPIARKMEEVFVKLYNKNAADDMSPLAALSLFYEFRDLVPTGTDGDIMIRNLAERLVKIDLLERASQLLSHQIRNRLQGTERSRVGVRLAEIYLMNHQPKQALEILKTTGYGELAADVQLNRIRLTAEALAQQGQLDKAIEVLSSDTSAEGNLLRLSVYWTNRDWANVVTTAEEILSNRNDPSAALTLPESEVLIKLATAYVYEHDSGQIQYLRDYFTPLLKGNPNKDSFLFITSESGSLDYNNLANLDSDIHTVKHFIDKSRKSGTAQKPAIGKPAAPVASTAAPEPKKVVN